MPNIKKCSFCKELGHTKFYCPKKPRATPKQVGKYGNRWIKTRQAWIKLFGLQGHHCHYCHKPLEPEDLTLDHLIARSRAPKLRFELTNLVPSCWTCNGLKGSLAHEEYQHICYTEVVII